MICMLNDIDVCNFNTEHTEKGKHEPCVPPMYSTLIDIESKSKEKCSAAF